MQSYNGWQNLKFRDFSKQFQKLDIDACLKHVIYEWHIEIDKLNIINDSTMDIFLLKTRIYKIVQDVPIKMRIKEISITFSRIVKLCLFDKFAHEHGRVNPWWTHVNHMLDTKQTLKCKLFKKCQLKLIRWITFPCLDFEHYGPYNIWQIVKLKFKSLLCYHI